jgi:hypothetical protein
LKLISSRRMVAPSGGNLGLSISPTREPGKAAKDRRRIKTRAGDCWNHNLAVRGGPARPTGRDSGAIVATRSHARYRPRSGDQSRDRGKSKGVTGPLDRSSRDKRSTGLHSFRWHQDGGAAEFCARPINRSAPDLDRSGPNEKAKAVPHLRMKACSPTFRVPPSPPRDL